jgi:hypothetical protein
MKRAKIKEDAPRIFWEETLKTFRRAERIPETYREFKKRLEELAGKVFEIEREYDDRIQLKYPPELVERLPTGEVITGIDVEKKLVEVVGD